jgi:copper resistance protein C
MRHRLVAAAALAGGLSAAFAATAFAHTYLDHADPSVGSTVKAAPAQLRIWFTGALEPAFSTIAVSDAQGNSVAPGKASVDPGDNKLLAIGLGALPPGSYKVVWHAVSVDTHVTEGIFTFTVAP